MTKIEASELAKILQAYADGKTLQYIEDERGYTDIEPDTLDDECLSIYQLRIKPESKRMPLTEQDLIERELSGKTMRVKFDKTIMLITDFDDTYAWISGEKHEYGAFMFCYTFLDGTPCYKEVEGE